MGLDLTTEAQTFAAALLDDPDALAKLAELRGWTAEAIQRLGVGSAPPSACRRLTGIGTRLRRVTFPEQNADGTVVNLMFHAPDPGKRDTARERKAYAVPQTRRDLFPAPETVEGDELWIVEGGPDCVAGWSIGIPCVAIPGTGKWDASWAQRLARFNLYVALDSDKPGQDKARQVAAKLARRAESVRLVEVPADDLNALLVTAGPEKALQALGEAQEAATLVVPRRIVALPGKDFYATLKPRDEADDLLGPLLRRNTRVGIAGFIGEGKTSLTLQMVAASAYGEQFFNWRGRGGNTRWLILDLEQGHSEIAKRLDETGISKRNGNVHYAHLPDGLQIDRSEEDREMLEDLLSQGWDGVALDPAYALLSSEPETEYAARQFATTLDRLHREFDFCLVVPMHTRKPLPKTQLTLADVYGWSTLTRNTQVVLGIQIWKPWVSVLSILKDRSGDVGPKGSATKIGYDHTRLFHPIDETAHGQGSLEDEAA